MQLAFDATTRSADFRVNILQDTLIELPESFNVYITNVSVFDINLAQLNLSAQERDRILFSPDRAILTIIDDDGEAYLIVNPKNVGGKYRILQLVPRIDTIESCITMS